MFPFKREHAVSARLYSRTSVHDLQPISKFSKAPKYTQHPVSITHVEINNSIDVNQVRDREGYIVDERVY